MRVDREDIADYIRRTRRASQWSCKDISIRAREKGFAISKSYVARLENREIMRPSLEKLTALAAGLGVAPTEIDALARGQSPATPRGREATLLNMFRALPASTQDELFEITHCLYRRRVTAKKKRANPPTGNSSRTR
jgi:transcriptional regulator with XRE-family HTH domain